MLSELRDRLDAQSARLTANFPYFLPRSAPVSGASAVMDYDCSFVATMDHLEDDFILGVKVPVTTLCPCSKAISDRGAHNQRGTIAMRVRSERTNGISALIWIEELVEVAERSASAPVYPLLKRPDERHVTMQAFDSPVFVEDVVRNVATRLRQDSRVAWFHVHAVNQESIHNHDAFAELEWVRSESNA